MLLLRLAFLFKHLFLARIPILKLLQCDLVVAIGVRPSLARENQIREHLGVGIAKLRRKRVHHFAAVDETVGVLVHGFELYIRREEEERTDRKNFGRRNGRKITQPEA